MSPTATIPAAHWLTASRQRTPRRHHITVMIAKTVTGMFADPKFVFGGYQGALSYGADDVLLSVENGA